MYRVLLSRCQCTTDLRCSNLRQWEGPSGYRKTLSYRRDSNLGLLGPKSNALTAWPHANFRYNLQCMPNIIEGHCIHRFNAPQVDQAWNRRDRAGALAASNQAIRMNIGGICCGSIIYGIVIVIIIINATTG